MKIKFEIEIDTEKDENVVVELLETLAEIKNKLTNLQGERDE